MEPKKIELVLFRLLLLLVLDSVFPFAQNIIRSQHYSFVFFSLCNMACVNDAFSELLYIIITFSKFIFKAFLK